jgi:hypothetical protein
MTFRTDPARTNIAKDILSGMLSGVMSVSVPPGYSQQFRDGMLQLPKLAVVLADMLTKELDAVGVTENQHEPQDYNI